MIDASIQFQYFLVNPNEYQSNNPRIKIQPIETFKPDDPIDHWCVDRWWNENELVTLGIKKQKSEATKES